MPLDDSWEWDVLYHSGTVILKMSPIVFWKSTPRKLNRLVKTYIELNGDDKQEGRNSSQKRGYIDQVF